MFIFSTFLAAVVYGSSCAKGGFLGLIPWYQYLQVDNATSCNIVNFQLLGSHSSIILILLAVVDDLLRLAGIVAVGYVIYGGFKYLTSQGAPDAIASAQKTILNALIGLALTIISVGLIGFLGSRLG